MIPSNYRGFGYVEIILPEDHLRGGTNASHHPAWIILKINLKKASSSRETMTSYKILVQLHFRSLSSEINLNIKFKS